MALVDCPECLKRISETAKACPGCGLPITPEILAVHELKQRKIKEKENEDKITVSWLCRTLAIATILTTLIIISSIQEKTSTSKSLSPLARQLEDEWSPPAPQPTVKSDYATDEARLRELGQKYYPTYREIWEYGVLDARQAVREGSMSKSAYERQTKQKFPDD